MKKKIFLKPDARNRICLTKILKPMPYMLQAYEKNGKIILEPLAQVPAEEAWLFKPENKKILAEVKKGLQQKGTVNRGTFKKLLKKKS